MEAVSRMGVDLAKRVIQLHCVDRQEHVILRRSIPTERFAEFMSRLQPCDVAMEACASAHHWARKLTAMGDSVRLIAPQFVAPYRKGGARCKNDAADAEAICEAAARPTMRFVQVKTVEQQGIATLHRMRQGWLEERTALINRLRGLLAEFGITIPQRIEALRRIPEILEDANNELPGITRGALYAAWEHLKVLDERMREVDRQIEQHAKQDDRASRIMALPGVGPITASALIAAVGNAREFKNGRQFAAWLGLAPRQNSSGGKSQLGSITKRGDSYLRMLLVLGARSALMTAGRRTDRLSRWLQEVQGRLGWQKALVALANKHARIIWALLTRDESFRPDHVPACFTPMQPQEQ
ncbi:IS110 family transposase [Burkholderia cenocepacia]|uniref:IS110 family transposase n=1 Tax=Burkholderia cenocepacia TaxID=95486 RepID=UPI002B244F00|nr:IS110 family transposase [Burkholderia cenocepacia]MEB2499834.1 IS110 family transposase [Burkholderia cenocepacia]